MSFELDPRVVRLGLQIGDQVKFYEDLSIYAKGTKFTSSNQGEAEFTIVNLNRETREQLMQEANPFNSNPQKKSIILEVGRESYETSVLYQGDIFRVRPSGKPDIGLTIRCLTGHFNKGSLLARSFSGISELFDIAKQTADDNNLGLSFEIESKKIGNYFFSGTPFEQIVNLEDLALSDVFVDNSTLYVKKSAQPKIGSTLKILNKTSGMIGIPEGTESGVRVSMLYDPVVQLGSRIQLESEINPILNGDYIIYKLEFDISSRDTAFYLHVEARPL